MNEPRLRVGLVLAAPHVRITLDKTFHLESEAGAVALPPGTALRAVAVDGGVRLEDGEGHVLGQGRGVRARPGTGATFTLHGMTVGTHFHWEHAEDLRFKGRLALEPAGLDEDGEPVLRVVNEVLLEDYLVSVVSSEMSATCPPELLRAHAVISRSWLVAQLESAGQAVLSPPDPIKEPGSPPVHRIVRWYDRQQHQGFDVCADDHCQRYQGVTRAATPEAALAVEATRGLFLVHEGRVCDARFSKCCGGLTEIFPSAWGGVHVPYLQAFADAPEEGVPHAALVDSEEGAQAFLRSAPPAWCNTRDRSLLERLLPKLDHDTQDFYRWRVVLPRDQARSLIREKTGVDPGQVLSLRALKRGPSGRITLLEIQGSLAVLRVGKELEIRRILSPTHLYSSAFVVDQELDGFVLTGAGWGHGVGLCQIGAAVMAASGQDHRAILRHYYRGAALEKLY